jgi:NAD(P)H-hydrate repair Nnr-like enzyme with NAD(P)H-hydrate epimerase domain
MAATATSSRGSCGRGAGTVRVLGMGETAAMPPDARANRERWETMGAVAPLTHAGLRDGPESDLYIDAVFGTGLKRAPDGDLLELLRDLGVGGDAPFAGPRLWRWTRPRVSTSTAGGCWRVGGPSPSSASVPLCSLTVTFEVPKVGHVLADGPACCGRRNCRPRAVEMAARRDAARAGREPGQKPDPRAD